MWFYRGPIVSFFGFRGNYMFKIKGDPRFMLRGDYSFTRPHFLVFIGQIHDHLFVPPHLHLPADLMVLCRSSLRGLYLGLVASRLRSKSFLCQRTKV